MIEENYLSYPTSVKLAMGIPKSYLDIPDNEQPIPPVPPVPPVPVKNSKLYYTSSVFLEASSSAFDAPILSVEYNDGQGIITFDGELTEIKSYPFGDIYEELESITIPDEVITIGNNAFSGCSGLTSIEIPNSVKSIGESAFANCTNLTSATIGNSVMSIGEDAFSSCTSLTSIDIPNSVTSIESGAFADCGLTSIEIGNSVTSIGDYAFEYCPLTSVTIGNSVTSIGSGAFEECGDLTSIEIPASVTSIGSGALAIGNEDDGRTIILKSATPIVLEEEGEAILAFGEKSAEYEGGGITIKIYVPTEAYNTYHDSEDAGWEYYRDCLDTLSEE